MIFEISVDDSELVPAIAKELSENWQSDICEAVAENIDASDIAEHVSAYDVAQELDADAIFANIEIDYEDLAEHIVSNSDFKNEVAGLMWQQFSDEFGASMKCVREEIALMNVDIERLSLPFWRRWFNLADKKEVAAS